MTKYLLVALMFILSGCWKYNISNIGKYPTEAEQYGVWQKPKIKSTVVDIKKALLECGKISLGGVSQEIYEKVGIIEDKDQTNHGFLVNRCMEGAGYVDTGRYKVKDFCSWDKYKSLSACQPDAIIPTPSVERRLNSWYCKVETDYNYCLKFALAPQLCSPEKIKTPLPECLAPGQAYAPQQSTEASSKNYEETVTPMRDYPEKSIQLQQNTQTQSNRDMKSLLKNTEVKRK
jgi:hypothetical protein